MRLKTFNAESMAQAMVLVKEQFGNDAIIVSSQKGEGGLGVRVTAAMDSGDDDLGFEHNVFDDIDKLDPIDAITEALAHHNIPAELSDALVRIASNIEVDEPALALAGALDQRFKFSSLPAGKGAGNLIFVGMPGAGKTVTVAKLATRAVMEKRPVHVITTDTVRAGGFQQLDAFTSLLGLELISADSPQSLADAVAAAPNGAQTLIDCAGGNPFDPDDFDSQMDLIRAVEAEIVLVVAAGGDPFEAAEIADIYSQMGAGRLLVTRLDVARRLGAMLNAADAGQMRFSDVSLSPSVAEGLNPLNPISLARLLLPHSQNLNLTQDTSEFFGEEARSWPGTAAE